MSTGPDDQKRRRLQQRLVELRNQLHEISGGEHQFGPATDDLSLEEEVAFLEHILAFETAPRTTWRERLRKAGYEMPDPAGLTDEQIGLEVWQVIQRLSELNAYLYSTNHLSDRELYEQLYHETLAGETVEVPAHPDSACHLDLAGTGSDEDTETWLRYYADAEERRRWRAEFPDTALPPRERPPYDRDHLLPKRPDPTNDLYDFLNRLIDADWNDPTGVVRLAADLPYDALAPVPFYAAARVLLEKMEEQGRVKATAKLGNLCRAFVNEVHPLLPLTPAERRHYDTYVKVRNEEDIVLLNKVRFAAEDAGFIRRRKGYFSLTRAGKAVLDPGQAGSLYRSLFITFFRKINLGYFDRCPDLPGIQATLSITLWRLGMVARDFTDCATLQAETLVPDVLDEIEETSAFLSEGGSALRTRVLRHLADFGLLEPDTASGISFDIARAYRVTPLFSRFLSFDETGLPD